MMPEQRLHVAVLRQALVDKDTVWVQADTYGSGGITFLGCCQALGLDPRRVRLVLSSAEGWDRALTLLDRWVLSQGQRTSGRQIGRRFAEVA